MSSALTPEQLAALQQALGILSALPNGVELRAYITAGTEGQTDPPGKDYMLSVRVEGNVTPPIPTPDPTPTPDPNPPPPQPVTMYVTSTNGMYTHSATDVTVASRVGSFAFRAAVKVNPDTTTANGYIWRIIAAGEKAAGLFIAEKKADGSETYLSLNP